MTYEDYTREQLIQRLRVLESPSSERVEIVENERLLHDLRVHQAELEAQNESLRETQEELEAAHNRYQDLYDFAPIAYCTFDNHGVLLEINLTGATMLGRARAHIVGKPFHVVARIVHYDAFLDHVKRTLCSEVPVITELTIDTGDGSSHELQLISSAVLSPNRGPTLRTAFLDVSAQRRAEREARAEKAVRARIDATDRAAAAVSGALAKLAVNDFADFLQVIVDQARVALGAQFAALGLAGEHSATFESWAFSGMSSAKLQAIAPAPEALARALRLADMRESAVFADFVAEHPQLTRFLGVPIVYQQRTRAHLYVANLSSASEFSAEDQALAELLAERIGVALEIARLRRAEADERKAADLLADRLASVIENTDDALALYDADKHLVLCNSAYRELVGSVPEGSLQGKPYAERLDAGLGRIAHITEQEHAAPFDAFERFDVRLQDGRSLRVCNRPTAEGGRVQTILDLSDEARREQELSDARGAAERASAAKSDFLSSMSHELRTPLNAILGFSQLLALDRKQPLAPRHLERLQHIERAGKHLLQLIEEVLDLSRIESGTMSISIEAVSVSDVLADVAATLATAASTSDIQLLAPAPDAAIPNVLADRTRFKQVLMNFGSNAIKYGRKGGRVEFRVSQHDGMVRIAAADDGLGIPAAKQASVFMPFQRAGRETGPVEGTGIGLTIAKRLTEMMAGHIGFESVEDRGSEFWIELPVDVAARAPTTAQPHHDGVERRALSSSARAHIVYVEDNAQSVALMRDLLSDLDGISLETAATAELGLELVRRTKPDLVILDIDLPGLNGLDAARHLRAWPETRAIPLIALSAGVMPRQVQRIYDAGFNRHLSKPVNVDELLQSFEELLPAHT